MSDVLDFTAVQHATAEGGILVAHCPRCGNEQAMPAGSCFRCGSDTLEVGQHTGDGTLYSWTVTGTAFEPELADEVPYVVAVILLRGGAKIWGRLVGLAPTSPQLCAQLSLQLDARLTKERGYLVFGPRGADELPSPLQDH